MLGQNIGVHYLLPLAIDRLEGNALAAGDYYPGDLLRNVLRLGREVWDKYPDLRFRAFGILEKLEEIPEEVEDALEDFMKRSGPAAP